MRWVRVSNREYEGKLRWARELTEIEIVNVRWARELTGIERGECTEMVVERRSKMFLRWRRQKKKRVLVHLINRSITSSENYLFCENEKLVKVGSTLWVTNFDVFWSLGTKEVAGPTHRCPYRPFGSLSTPVPSAWSLWAGCLLKAFDCAIQNVPV